MINYNVGDTITTKKPHACGCNKWQITRTGCDYKIKWQITRTGCDYKIKCVKCGREVMLDSSKFHKAVKGVDK